MKDKVIDNLKYQVFLFHGRLNFPYNFAVHTWICTNKKGEINRYEVLSKRHKKDKKYGYLHKNFLKPMEWFYDDIKNRKMYSYIEGKENSSAHEIIKFIEKNLDKYPYQKKYKHFPGPNSNTFTSWILKNNKKSGLKMPINAIGKNYIKIFR